MYNEKLINIRTIILEKEIDINYIKLYYIKLINRPFFKLFNNFNKNYKILNSTWFTKNTNLEKLFVYSKLGFFSPGIVLICMQTPYKFLKKKLKTWMYYIDVFEKVFLNPSVLYFKNMFGYKYKIIEKFLKKTNNLKIFWIFIKLFYLNFIFIKKKKKKNKTLSY